MWAHLSFQNIEENIKLACCIFLTNIQMWVLYFIFHINDVNKITASTFPPCVLLKKINTYRSNSGKKDQIWP